MSLKTGVLTGILFAGLMVGCNSNKKKQPAYSQQEVQEALLAYNKRLAEHIKAEIEAFVQASQDSFQRAEEGYYFRTVGQGNGIYPQENDRVYCRVVFSMLDGTLCYPEKTEKIEEFVVGKNTLTILNHALKKVDVGGEIQAVVSPYMGFGLNGDGKNIPPARAFLVNISLLKVNSEGIK